MIRLLADARNDSAHRALPRSVTRTLRWLAVAAVAVVAVVAAAPTAVGALAQVKADEIGDTTTAGAVEAAGDNPADAANDLAGNADDGTAAASDATAAKDESRQIRARFSDGTVLVGELLLDELEVETEFGTLVVPRQQLLGFSPGLDSRAEFDDRIDALVSALISSDRAAASAAERELVRFGPAIADELDRRAGELDGDDAKRIAALADRIADADIDFDALGGPQARPLIRKDRVRTTRFTIVGRIVPRQLRLRSRYGEIEADLADIVAVERPSEEQREDVAKSFAVTGQNLVQTEMKKTGVSVRKGDRVAVRASGLIHRTPGTSTYVSSPDGSTRFGTYSTNPHILGGTLVARIGRSGKVIKVGSNATFMASEDGVLSFGVAMRPDYVGRYPFPGEYNVKLRVQRGD